MQVLLKIVIILQLLVSGAAVFFGWKTFDQRKVIKDRTLNLEKSVHKFAGNLQYAEEDLAALPKKLKDPGNMKAALLQVETFATGKQETLDETLQNLADEKTAHEQTTENLEATKTELATANDTVAEQKTEIEQAATDLAAAKDEATMLQGEVANLKTNIDDLEGQIADKQELIAQHEDSIQGLKRENKELWAKTPEGRKFSQQAAGKDMQDIKGSIIAVNSEWNFVVLDLGSDIGMKSGVDAIVHRADQLVGKVKISSVDEKSCVANIIPEWMELDIQKGDQIFFQ